MSDEMDMTITPERRTHRHAPPRIMPLPRNAITSFQLVNNGVLAWWTITFFAHYEQYDRLPQFETLFRILPSVFWWGVVTLGILVVNVAPLIPWWTRTVNHAFRTKYAGLLASAVWWGFLAGMFAQLSGLDSIGTGIHLVLMLGAMFEFGRLTRWGRV